MKVSSPPPDYLPASLLREEVLPPTELEVQALWFEQLCPPRLTTEDGDTLEVIQAGFWNHGGGPDFDRGVVRLHARGAAAPEIRVGNIEVHLRPSDWQAHGHDLDPAYDRTILHVVWENPGRKAFFPATSSFRRVPQLVLGSQLVAPWAELRPLCQTLTRGPLPGAAPGRCSAVLAALPAEKVAAILRAAGTFRLRQKAQRWLWRRRLAGDEQALFEALAEALGFHANQIPMRLVAQRLPWTQLRPMTPPARFAHLFGLSGFLPDESLARLQAEPRGWLRELWEIWWKARGPLDYALLPRSQWRLSGLRPLNRPERRIAALAHLVPKIPALGQALRDRDAPGFSAVLLSVEDPFWEKHATLHGAPLASPCRLIGEERVQDILINIFWPWVLLEDASAAQEGMTKMTAAPNTPARVATQRMLLAPLNPRQAREALIQQGLLQVFRDYCQTDCSSCQDCTFPELVQKWEA